MSRQYSLVVVVLSGMLLAPLPAAAADSGVATVRVGKEIKTAFGRIKQLQDGDVSCVMVMDDDRGREFIESGAFELCEQKKTLIGKRVQLRYRMEKVLAESCQGNVDCGKSDTVALVTGATVVGGGAPLSPAPAPARQASFCTSQETLLLGCAAGARLMSVCASRDLDAAKGYIQYRFGKPSGAPEQVVPEGFVHPSKAVTGSSETYAGGGAVWLRFRKGDHAYVAYSGIGRWGPKGSPLAKDGVAVERNGKLIANVKCTGGVAGELSPDWFEKTGVSVRKDEEFFLP